MVSCICICVCACECVYPLCCPRDSSSVLLMINNCTSGNLTILVVCMTRLHDISPPLLFIVNNNSSVKWKWSLVLHMVCNVSFVPWKKSAQKCWNHVNIWWYWSSLWLQKQNTKWPVCTASYWNFVSKEQTNFLFDLIEINRYTTV